MKVCYLVLAYNNFIDTVETLECIRNQEGFPAEIQILVVDNNSKDEFSVPLKNWCENNTIKYIYRNINDGYAGGNNFGWELIKDKYKYIFVVNNDIVINNSKVTLEICKILDSDETIGIAGPVIYFGNNEKLASVRGLRDLYFSHLFEHKFNIYNKYEDCDSVIGCFLGINPKCIGTMELFDDSFFMYGEELNLGLRTWKNGYRVVHLTDDEYSVYHKGGANPYGKATKWKFYLSMRNSVLCVRQLSRNRFFYLLILLFSSLRTFFNFSYPFRYRRFSMKGFFSGLRLLRKNKEEILLDAKNMIEKI